MLCGLIMAGGKGTRFWPASTEKKPKQFLSLTDDKTMLQLTVSRLNKIMPLSQIFIVTGESYKYLVQEQIKGLQEENIILEPTGRNTAPCILLSCLYISKIYENSNIAVFPSDHTIEDVDTFVNSIRIANEYIDKNKEAIITIGIKPTHAETDYGYIKCIKNDEEVLKVERFVEKPTLSKANEYLADDHYLWNAGMFVFSSNEMLMECSKYIPAIYDKLKILEEIEFHDFNKTVQQIYHECDSISIDYAIMEKSKHIFVIPSSFGWDDVGNWKALERYMKIDLDGNIKKGEAKFLNSENNVVYSTDKEIILLNVNDIYCVETNDKVVIGYKDELDLLHKYRGKI